MNNLEENKEKIYEIIEKMYENDDLSDKEIDLKVEKALENGKIDIYYTETEEGYPLETKYNLNKEQLEFSINEKIQEVHEFNINKMLEYADMPIEEFHQEFSSLSTDSEIKEEIEVDPWAKQLEGFKSKDNSLENEI